MFLSFPFLSAVFLLYSPTRQDINLANGGYAMMLALSRYSGARLDPGMPYWPQVLIVDTASTPNIDAIML